MILSFSERCGIIHGVAESQWIAHMCSPGEDPVYQYMAKKRSEGRKHQVYMMASANKFLRRYYASVNTYLDTLGST